MQLSKSISSLKKVYQKKISYVWSILGALLFVTFVVVTTQAQLLRIVLTLPVYTVSDKFNAFFASYGTLSTNFGLAQKIIMGVSAVLFGMTLAAIAFYMRRQLKATRAAGGSLAGAMIGVLGVGCSACGSVLITSILGTSASLFVTNYFPLGGLEFGLIGVVVMIYALNNILTKIASPNVCAPVDVKR